mgnify:CR=1 FL=1
MALASKKLNYEIKSKKKNFLEAEKSLINHKIYILCNQYDLMEGISDEALSIAGNLGLNNLIVLLVIKYIENPSTNGIKADIAKLDVDIIKNVHPQFPELTLDDSLRKKMCTSHTKLFRMLLTIMAYMEPSQKEILENRPSRGGRVMPVEASDFAAKSALYLPKEAQYDYLVNLPSDISSAGLVNKEGHVMNSLGEVVNNAMALVEEQSEQLVGVLPKDYTMFNDDLLGELLRIFNNSALDEIGGDIIGRIYEYFLNKFAKNIASDDGVFFTPKSLVKMIVNIIEPKSGILLDPACGSGGGLFLSGQAHCR